MNTVKKMGSTLIEVMISCLILAVIAITGATYLAHASSTVAVQRNRISALATANRYLEEWRGTSWGTVTNLLPKPTRTGAKVLVRRTGICSWSAGSVGFVTNNGVRMSVTNTINYIDADGGSASFDCVQVTVEVSNPKSPNATVSLQTILGTP